MPPRTARWKARLQLYLRFAECAAVGHPVLRSDDPAVDGEWVPVDEEGPVYDCRSRARVFEGGYVFPEEAAREVGCGERSFRGVASVLAEVDGSIAYEKKVVEGIPLVRSRSFKHWDGVPLEPIEALQEEARRVVYDYEVLGRHIPLPCLRSAPSLLAISIEKLVERLRCKSTQDVDLSMLPAELINEVMARLRELNLLDSRTLRMLLVPMLRVCDLNEIKYVGDGILRKLLMQCHNLVILRLASKVTVTDSFLERLAATCKGLQELDISSCPHVTERGVRALCSLPFLNVLHIGGIKSLSMECQAAVRERLVANAAGEVSVKVGLRERPAHELFGVERSDRQVRRRRHRYGRVRFGQDRCRTVPMGLHSMQPVEETNCCNMVLVVVVISLSVLPAISWLLPALWRFFSF